MAAPVFQKIAHKLYSSIPVETRLSRERYLEITQGKMETSKGIIDAKVDVIKTQNKS